jgi:hypothetical protein
LSAVIRSRLIVLSIVAATATGGLGAVAAPASAALVTHGPGVVIGGPQVKPGAKCAKGTAGCKHGKFTGQFFG